MLPHATTPFTPPAQVSMSGVNRIAGLLKRRMLSTDQGPVTPNHLRSYLQELTFRFDRRASRSRGIVFRRLLDRAVASGSRARPTPDGLLHAL